MKTQENLHAQETDPRLLEALASLNQISAAINHIDPSDAGNRAVSLQLIVESSIRVIPGSSAVIYTYDKTPVHLKMNRVYQQSRRGISLHLG